MEIFILYATTLFTLLVMGCLMTSQIKHNSRLDAVEKMIKIIESSDYNNYKPCHITGQVFHVDSMVKVEYFHISLCTIGVKRHTLYYSKQHAPKYNKVVIENGVETYFKTEPSKEIQVDSNGKPIK